MRDYIFTCSEPMKPSITSSCNANHVYLLTPFITTISEFLGLPRDAPIVNAVTESEAVIKWKKIDEVPGDLSDQFEYVIEYEEQASGKWVVWPTRQSHNPSSDQYQEDTLTGLMYNTVYNVEVQSYRLLGSDRELTADTLNTEFKTLCRGKPVALLSIYAQKLF